MSETTETITKSWKREGIYSTYEDADAAKQALRAKHTADNDLLIKIKRCGPEGTRYQVKTWHPDMLAPKKNKKKSK